jgi:cobalt-zinc-cadmium efflux system outer membrane protein
MSLSLGRPLIAVGLAVAVLASFSPSQAATAGAAAPSYESLIARLDQMPSSVEAEALSEAARARADQARALPNPSINLEAENIYGSGPYGGFGGADTTVSVSQPLELFGQRRARIGAAISEADVVSLRSDLMRWQAAARIAQVYAEAEAADRRFDLAEEALALIEQDARAVSLLIDEGREPALRGVQAESEVGAARAARDEAQAIRAAAFARLSAIAMLDAPVERIEESLLDRNPGATVDSSETPLAVQIAEAEVEASRRQLVVEQRRRRPEISATLGSRRFRETGDDAFTIGLSVSIPLFDRNRGGIRAAYADQRAAEARLVAQEQEARADRLAAEATLTASATRTAAADSGVVAGEEAYRLARVGFDAGRISQLELRNTRAALITARNTAVDARLARVRAEIDLARLEGRAPFGDSP